MNWHRRYAAERKRRYRRYNYRSVNSPGPDNGGVPLSHPFTALYLDQLEREVYDPRNYAGQDSSGRVFVDAPQYGLAPLDVHLERINTLRNLQKNPNTLIGVSRETGWEGNDAPQPGEEGINPGDHVALDLDITQDRVTDWGAERLIPVKHFYYSPEYAPLVWGGYHPRRGLDRNIYGEPNYTKTTVDQAVERLMKSPVLGREDILEFHQPKMYDVQSLDSYQQL